MNRYERLLETPLLRILRNTTATVRALVFVVGFVGGSAAFIYYALSRSALSPDAAIALLVAVAVLLLGALGIWFYVAGVYDPPFYRIIELEGLCVIEPVADRHRYTYTRRQILRATRGNLRLIEIRSHWTGRCSREHNSTRPLHPDHILLDGQHPEEDGRIHRWIYPGYALHRGDEIEVGVHQVMEDDLEPMIPYYREGGGRYRTERLKVIARFMVGHEPARATGLVWNTNRRAQHSNQVGRLDYVRRPDPANGTVDYIVEVEHPRLYHSYGVRWTWR